MNQREVAVVDSKEGNVGSAGYVFCFQFVSPSSLSVCTSSM